MLSLDSMSIGITGPTGTREFFSAHGELEGGGTHVITGPSGCGKTLLLKSILGVEGVDVSTTGRVLFAQNDLRKLSTEDIVELGVGYVAQNPLDNFHQPTVNDELVSVFLYRGWPWAQAMDAVADLVHRMGLADVANRSPYELSGGEVQRGAVAAALAHARKGTSQLLLLDEPLSFLDPAGVDAVLGLLKERSPSATIVAISHRPEDFAALHPTHWEVRDRFLARTTAISKTHGDPSPGTSEPQRRAESAEEILVARDLTFAIGDRRVIVPEFSLSRGELVALRGQNGSGKSSLCRVLAGLAHYDGTVTLEGAEISSLDARELARTVAWVWQIPQQMFLCDTVENELRLLAELGKQEPDSDGLHEVAGKHSLEPVLPQFVETLSGGEARRAAVASTAGMGGAKIWLLDEPEFGLDAESQLTLSRLVLEHCQSGGAVLNVSHGNLLSSISHRTYEISESGEVKVVPGPPFAPVPDAGGTGLRVRTEASGPTARGIELLHPLPRLLGIVLVLPALIFLAQWPLAAPCGVVALAAVLLSRNRRSVLRDLRPVVVVMGLIATVGFVAWAAGGWHGGGFYADVALRFLGASASGAVAMRSVSSREVLSVLQAIRLPQQLVVLAAMVLRMYPSVTDAVERRYLALAARGGAIRWRPGHLGRSIVNAARLLIPSLLDVVELGIRLGTLLRLRGYSGKRRMTRIPLGPMGLADYLALGVICALLGSLFLFWGPVQM